MAQNNNEEIKGMAQNIYLWSWALIIFLLIILPLYNIFIWTNGNVWIIWQIYNGISYNGSSQLADFNTVKTIIGWIIGSIIIFFVVYIHNDYLKSWLKTGLIHVVVATNKIVGNKDIKKSDPEQYSTLKIRIAIYSWVLIGMFIIYFSLIQNIVAQIVQWWISIIFLIWMIVQALVIMWFNTIVIKGLDSRNPTPEIDKNKIVYTDEQINNINNNPNAMWIEVAIALLIVSIASLWVSTQFSDYATNSITNSQYWNIIEWDWSSINNIITP